MTEQKKSNVLTLSDSIVVETNQDGAVVRVLMPSGEEIPHVSKVAISAEVDEIQTATITLAVRVNG